MENKKKTKVGMAVKFSFEEMMEFFQTRGDFPDDAQLSWVGVDMQRGIVKFQFLSATSKVELDEQGKGPPWFSEIPEGGEFPERTLLLYDEEVPSPTKS